MTMTQKTLFDAVPHSRDRDPASSFAAADRNIRSGQRQADCEKVLTVMEQLLAVNYFQRVTALEIAYPYGKEAGAVLDRHMVSRRLPDLVRLGRVGRGTKVCSICGHETLAFWIER